MKKNCATKHRNARDTPPQGSSGIHASSCSAGTRGQGASGRHSPAAMVDTWAFRPVNLWAGWANTYTPFVTTEHTDSNLQRLRISAERQRPCKAPTGCDGHSQLFWWWLQGKPQVCGRQRARTGAGWTWPGVQPAAAAYSCWRAAVSKLVGHATYSPCPCCAIPHVGPPAQASRHRTADS
jgi:hypothetical protein